jgi:hypothetical protein
VPLPIVFGNALIDDRRLEACSVVGDGQHDPVPGAEEPDRHLGRPRMLVDVREHLGCSAVTVERRPAAVSLSTA